MSTYPNITDNNPNNIGPRGFYYILDKLKKYLLGNPNEGQVQGNVDMYNIKTVTYGDITEIDLNKKPDAIQKISRRGSFLSLKQYKI